METQSKPANHWSTHPWKLSILLAASLAVLSAAHLALLLALLKGVLFPAADPAQIMVFSLFLLLLLGMCYAALAAVVLGTQTRQALTDPARNRVGWAALPGLAVVVAITLVAFLRPVSAMDSPANYYLNNLGSLLGSLVSAALPVLLAAMLFPVLRKTIHRTIGALAVAAVLFVPSLVQQGYLMLSGNETQLWPWMSIDPLQTLAYALVATALFAATGRRLWDALALQWGLCLLLGALSRTWTMGTGADIPVWLGGAKSLLVWALPALAALYCLLLWDRGASPADPFKALGRRIGALARHFLPT